MSLVMSLRVPAAMEHHRWLNWIFARHGESVGYHWPAIIIGAVLAALLLWWFRRLPYCRTEEEQLQEALDHQKPAEIKYEAVDAAG
jgi:hypothetical protein